MEFSVLEQSDDVTVIALSGRLDVSGVQAIQPDFMAAIKGSDKPTIVNMEGVEFTASMGIGMLLAAAKALQTKELKMALLSPRELVDMALKAAKLDQILTIVYDMAEAKRVVS